MCGRSYWTGESLHTAGIVQDTFTPQSPRCSGDRHGDLISEQTDWRAAQAAQQGRSLLGVGLSCQLETGKCGWDWDSLNCPELLQEFLRKCFSLSKTEGRKTTAPYFFWQLEENPEAHSARIQALFGWLQLHLREGQSFWRRQEKG